MQLGAERPFQRRRLRYDPTFRIEANYVVDRGIPFSRFLTDWTAEDRALLVAVKTENAERCYSCGSSEWEWMDNPDAYRAVTTVCLGCAARDREQRTSDDGPKVPGSSVKLVPSAQAERMESAKAVRPRSRRERSQR